MNHRRHSVKRITFWSGFLSWALFLSLTLYYLPSLLHLDEFRPQLIDLLESNCHCKVSMGNVQGQIIPYPGLVVTHVVFLEPTGKPRILASVNGVRLTISWRSLLKRQLIFQTIRFSRPRFILRREWGPSKEVQWVSFELPHTEPQNTGNTVDRWEVRYGEMEVWDLTTRPITKWIVDQLNGTYRVGLQAGALTGRSVSLGDHSLLDIRYNGLDSHPIQVHLNNVDLKPLQRLSPIPLPWLEGTAGLTLTAAIHPSLAVQLKIAPLLLSCLHGARLVGEASYQKENLHAKLETLTAKPMVLVLDAHFPSHQWDFDASLQNYDSTVIQGVSDNRWVRLLGGNGSFTVSAHYVPDSEIWGYSAMGKDFTLIGTDFHVPEGSVEGNTQQTMVQVGAFTAAGGTAQIRWLEPTASPDSTLDVTASSVTVREILQIFDLQSQPPNTAPGSAAPTWNPHGYEPWNISQGSLHALIHPNVFEIQQSSMVIEGMHLDLHGTFDLAAQNAQGQIQGSLLNVPLAPRVESFFKPPSPVSGTGQMNYILSFPLSSQWVQGLNGTLQLKATKGVLKFLKTFYRITAVLNLDTYFRLHLPQVSAQGIVFDQVNGALTFQNGVLSTQDLFLKSPNLNIGAVGSVNLPGESLKIRLRLEMFRFLEDILRDVPITHWIFKKPNKILLPLVVDVEGPWDHVEVR